MINQRRVDRVARAICSAARMHQDVKCPVCEQDQEDMFRHDPAHCTMVPQFRDEAVAAIREADR